MSINRRQLLCALPALPALARLASAASNAASDLAIAPEFTAQDQRDWINSAPLRWSSLAGRVVLLDFWAFECWNCYRSFPWLRAVEARFTPRGLSVIGIHSPELAAEHDRARVREKAREFKLEHPIMIDDDFRYWKALDNEYWPAYYLIDRRRRIRARYYGETHAGDAQATRIENAVDELLAEPS
jgi:thiol-disulfide isomerase/thioredoxin